MRRSLHPLIETGEIRRVALAFAAFFLLLSSYYILRPVRDEMGVQTGVENLQWLFTGTFVFTLLTVPIFGWVVKRVRRELLVPATYGFLAANLLAFFAAFLTGITTAEAAAFFIWLSVFNIFAVSLFWATVSDTFTTDQAHRLYGFVAAGGTAGAIAGPALTAVLARSVSTAVLLAIAAGQLLAATACLVALRKQRTRAPGAASRPIGGSILAGISLTLTTAKLRGLALLVMCYSAVSTVLYVEMVDLAGQAMTDSGERTAFFASIDLTVNVLALVVQLSGTRRIVKAWGVRAALTVVPLIVLTGLAVLATWRSLMVLAAVQVVHRAGDYALVRPGREMIYTTVDPERRYKAKSFIDMAVYRANDAASAWGVSAIRAAGVDPVLVAAIPVAALWISTGFKVGRRHDTLAHATNDPA